MSELAATKERMIRNNATYLGLDFTSSKYREMIERAKRQVKDVCNFAREVRQPHVTLLAPQFTSHQIASDIQISDSPRPITVRFSGELGWFDDRVVYAVLDKESRQKVKRLQGSLVDVLDIDDSETREWIRTTVPHATIATFKAGRLTVDDKNIIEANLSDIARELSGAEVAMLPTLFVNDGDGFNPAARFNLDSVAA